MNPIRVNTQRFVIIRRCLGLALCICLLFGQSYAALQHYGVGAGASTLGPELTLKGSFSPWLSFDVVGSYLPLRFAVTVDQTKYRADVHMQNAGLLMQLHPFGGAFQLVAGAYYNGNDLKLVTTSGSNVVIDGHTYALDQVASIHGHMHFKPFAPYLGVGWGSQHRRGLGLALDLGVLYQGTPSISITPEYGRDITEQMRKQISGDVQREAEDISHQLKKYARFYPVVSLSLYFF